MELLQLDEKPVEYKHKDVTFLVRKNATVADRLAIDCAGVLEKDGRVRFDLRNYYEVLIKTFVVGWAGVTRAGKDVAYSYDLLMNNFPMSDEGDLLIKLGTFISEQTGLYQKKEEEQKND